MDDKPDGITCEWPRTSRIVDENQADKSDILLFLLCDDDEERGRPNDMKHAKEKCNNETRPPERIPVRRIGDGNILNPAARTWGKESEIEEAAAMLSKRLPGSQAPS